MVQNVALNLLDGNNCNNDNEDCQNTISPITIYYEHHLQVPNGEEWIEFINGMNDEKACMIISGSLGQQITRRVHNMFQVDSIFIFRDNKKRHEQWAKE
jgi:hypothetical protein